MYKILKICLPLPSFNYGIKKTVSTKQKFKKTCLQNPLHDP
jgi:hypothetical protein